jgi:adenylosuccinate lyase
MKSYLSISPIDGRYCNHTYKLSDYFSEYALTKYRLEVEIEYFIYLTNNVILGENLDYSDKKWIRSFYEEFNDNYFNEIKNLEYTCNHDIKAIELFIRSKIKDSHLKHLIEFIHFGLTSQDINSLAYTLILKDWYTKIGKSEIENLTADILELSKKYQDISMPSRTHGQIASPTTFGKEIRVFVYRLEEQLKKLNSFKFRAKFSGAIGNFNAHHVAYPNIDWISFANDFLKTFNIERHMYTTQIDSYDDYSEFFDILRRINTIMIDFSRDMWTYISMDYLKLQSLDYEVGSSTMPHKVNPINFENAEGNLGIANALFTHFSEKLPISRLQRDLSDSTVLRNIGVPIAHSQIAFDQLRTGIYKVEINKEKIRLDLFSDWAIITEGIQTILRREGYSESYNCLKSVSRGKGPLSIYDIIKFIDSLDVKDHIKKELKSITPENYIGLINL